MTESRKVQLTSELDATGVKRGAEEIKGAVRDATRDVQASAKGASDAVAGIGDAGDKAAKKLDANTRSFAQSIQRATAAAEAGERGTAKYFETLASRRGLDAGFLKPYIDDLRKAEDAQRAASGTLNTLGVSAGQTRQALRQLPAQFTDIFTSLASGQTPLTVFIQQGGQIKDSFGGVRAALAGVASIITPTTVALGLGAAALGVLAYGYKTGAAEADAFRRSLVLTGNAAGESVSSLVQTARAVGDVVGGQAAASAALSQYVASGQRAAASLTLIAEAAIRLERVGGPAVRDTVTAFADLAKDPLKASIKLNEQTNFLTLSVYRQIKALEEQGKKTEAAALAQREFAEAGISRSKDLEKGLGSIERGWLAIKDAITGAKNALLDIGRQDTLEQQQDKIRKALEANARRTDRGDTYDPASGRVREGADSQRARLLEQAEALRKNIMLQGELAKAQAARAAAVKDAIAADNAATKAIKEHDAALEASRDAAKSWADTILDGRKIMADLEAETDGLTKSQKRLVEYLTSPAYLRNSEAMRKVAVETLIAGHNAEQAAAAKKALAKAMDDVTKATMANAEAIAKDIEAGQQTNESLRDQIDALTLTKEALLGKKAAQLDLAAAMYEQVAAQAAIDGLSAGEVEGYRTRAQLLREEIALRYQLYGAEVQKEAATASAAAWQRTADDIRGALTDAFRRSFEAGENFGTAFAKAIANEVKTRLATALAEAMASQVLGALGLQVVGGNASSAGNNYVQLASTAQSLYGYGKSAYGAVSGWFGASGTTLSSTAASQQVAMMAANGMTDAEIAAVLGTQGSEAAGLSGVGGSSAGWGAYAGWAALAVMAAMQGSADWSAGFRRQQASDSGTALGDASARTAQLFDDLGVSDRIADIISGATLTARAFGRSAPRVEAIGALGTIGAGDFSGSLYADVVEKGGWFRSDRRSQQFAALPDDLGRFLDDAAAVVYAKAKDFGAALGLPADQLATITSQVKIKLTDDAAQNQESISAALAAYGDDLVKSYKDAVAPLAQYGESTGQTIARVGGAIVGVNDVLNDLGLTALQTSIDGGKAAISLQGLFGGLDTLTQAAGGYLQNFYSDAERAQLTRNAIGQALGDVGLAVPATREAFRSLVEAQDLMSDGGRQAFTVLMSVQDAFAGITTAGRSAADIMAERQQLEGDLLSLQGDAAAIRERERAALDESNRALYDQVKALEDQKAAAERAAQVLAERSGLELQLLQLQGDTAAIRERERAALDESNRALYDQVKALEDQTSAAQQAAAAQQQATAVWAQSVNSLGNGLQAAFQQVLQQVQSEQQRLRSDADQAINAARNDAASRIRELESQASQRRSAYQSAIDGLGGNVQTLLGALAGDGGRGQAQTFLQTALGTLRSGGSVDLDRVRSAGGQLSQLDSGAFSTLQDYRRALASSANLLRDVQSASRNALSREQALIAAQQVAIEAAADDQIKAIELARDAQIGVLESQLAEARGQASTLISIDDGVHSLADAMARFGDALGAMALVSGQAGPTGRVIDTAGQQVYGSSTGAVVTRPAGAGLDQTVIKGLSGATTTADVLRQAVSALVAADNWARIVEVALAEGIDSNTLDGLMDWRPGTALAAAQLRGLPRFASGTNYVPRNMLAVVDEGERIVPKADNAELLRIQRDGAGAGALVAEVRALREEVAALRQQQLSAATQLVTNTRRSAEQLEQWEAVGMPATATA